MKEKALINKANAQLTDTTVFNTIKDAYKGHITAGNARSLDYVIKTANEYDNLSMLAKIKALQVIHDSETFKQVINNRTGKKFTKFYDYAENIARLGKTYANAYVQAGAYIDNDLNVLLPSADNHPQAWRGSSLLIIVEQLRAKKGENAEKIKDYIIKGYITPDMTDERIKKAIKERLSGKVKDLSDDIESDVNESDVDENESESDVDENESESDVETVNADPIIDNIVKRYYHDPVFKEYLIAYDNAQIKG